jgi:lipoyl(octanoyl) transferase
MFTRLDQAINLKNIKNPGNIEVVYTGRGGKFTYHGPGQRIIYPILNLGSQNRNKDLKLYIQNLEKLIIDTFGWIWH